MHAGELRHRIVIEQPTLTQSASGAAVETWATFLECWAAVEPLAGREYIAARQTANEVTHRVRLRWQAGVTDRMRVKFGSRVFRIEAALDVRERNIELQLMCVEVVV